jgi:hypothetical protein
MDSPEEGVELIILIQMKAIHLMAGRKEVSNDE